MVTNTMHIIGVILVFKQRKKVKQRDQRRIENREIKEG